MSPLDAKLLRDLWRVKGQATAIGMVMALGVMMIVMMTGLVASLDETRIAYYERYRLADIFAPVARAPERLVQRLAAIPGVAQAEGRIVGGALIDLPGLDLPVQARALSLPDRSTPRLNDIFLTDGRRPGGQHADEIVLLEGFAKAQRLRPGDTLRVTMNGARRTLRIVGLAQSPEFLYSTAPGEMIPDDARFGVIWMNQAAMAAAYDMQSSFNEALVSLARGKGESPVLDAIDRMLEPYGGRAAYPLADQISNRFVSEEIDGLRRTSKSVPAVFLAVAAFLLYIVINRMVQSEREEIGLMKAFGYTNAEVGAHYFKLVLAIAAGGALAGCLFGIASGRALIDVYTAYYKLPFLVFRLDPASFLIGVSVSILSASTGGLFVLRRVFALNPAAAMQPPAPPDYSKSGRIGLSLSQYLDQPSRMVLRRLTRQPGRMLGAVVGIGCGMALTVAMLSLYRSFDRAIDLSFDVIDRSDVSVSFNQPVSGNAALALRRIPGILLAEPVRVVPVVLRNGRNSYRGAINGVTAGARLGRALDKSLNPIELRQGGVVLGPALADILQIKPGDILTVDVREGRQPKFNIVVAGIAESLIGSPAYMDMGALNRALGEPGRISGTYLMVDDALAQQVYRRLKDMPTVAGVSVKADARAAFVKLMDQGAGAMRYVMGIVAFVITFGIIYNAARIAYAERQRDLASLRVIGFSRAEVAFVLLGELAVVTLAALPLGAALGHFLSFGIAAGFSTDLYQIPTAFSPESHGTAAIYVIAAALASGWIVKRDLDRADLVAALKTRE